MKKTRVTRNFIKDWVNSKFKQLEITNYECCDVIKTRYSSDAYEGGACHYHICCRHIESGRTAYFMCFYPMYYIQQEINGGYEFWLKFDRLNIIPNTTLELRKSS